MSSMREFVVSDQRLLILRSLREMTGYSANDSILDSCLEAYGHSISRDAVRTQMRWLEEQGLITVEKVGETLVAKLTGRGDDVATGQAVVDGVKKPRPV
ncbi:VpaChn25_0724 family phage protein [Aeromonas rivipollensis]|uniref:VpaChn25_0724 family phage protein n=1 Tax=Aeromonas rivipollensis TaxID=948519 RepID=UPI0038D1C787